MAYQPIYMPSGGLSESMRSLADSIAGMRQRQLEAERYAAQQARAAEETQYNRRRDAEEDKRLRVADRENVFTKAQTLAETKGADAAASFLEMHGYGPDGTDIGERVSAAFAGGQQAAPQAPGPAPDMGMPTPVPGRGTPTPRQLQMKAALDAQKAQAIDPPPEQFSRTPGADMFARQYAPEVEGEGGASVANAMRAQETQRESDAEAGDFGDEMAGMFKDPPIMSVQSNDPVVVNRQNQIRANQHSARQKLRYLNGRGDRITIDPMAAENAQRAQGERVRQENVRVFDEVVAQLDPETQKYAETMRPAVGVSRDPLKPGDILDHIASLRNRDTQLAAAASVKLGDRQYQEERDEREHARRLERDQRRPRRAAGGGAGAGAGKPVKMTEGQATAVSRLRVMLPEAETILSKPPLSESGRKALFEELALLNAAERNPTVDYGARLVGLRSSIEGKLQGTDRQVYDAYRAFLDPLVRQRTGANAPPTEVAALAGPIMDAIGDTDVDKQAKTNRMKNALYSFAEQAGPQRDAMKAEVDALFGAPRGGSNASSGRAPRAATVPLSSVPAAKRNQDLAEVNRQLQRKDLDPAKRKALEAFKARLGGG